MDDTNIDQSEWKTLCKEIASFYVPEEDAFPPNAFKTPKQQQELAAITLGQQLEMPEMCALIRNGLDSLKELLPQYSAEEQQGVNQLFDIFVSYMTAGASLPSSEESFVDIASLLQLPKAGLDTIDKMGKQWLQSAQWQKAAGVFTLLCLWQSSKDLHWFQRALALYYDNRWDECQQSIENALALNSQQPEYYLLLCSALLSKKEKDLAKEAHRQAQELLSTYRLVLPQVWADWNDTLQKQL
jgi:hypothetical protein